MAGEMEGKNAGTVVNVKVLGPSDSPEGTPRASHDKQQQPAAKVVATGYSKLYRYSAGANMASYIMECE